MSSDSGKIRKIVMDFDDPRIEGRLKYLVEDLSGDGITEMEVPFDTNEYNPANFTMNIYGDNNKSSIDIDYDMFLYLAKGLPDESEAVKRKLEDKKQKDSILKELDSSFFSFNAYSDQKFPMLRYADVTERDMFGYPAIKAVDLANTSHGLWAWSGLRKLEMEISGMLTDHEAVDCTASGALYWNRMDTMEIAPLFEKEVIANPSKNNEEKNYYTVYCDTNQLGDAIVDNDHNSASPLFNGRFELHFKYNRKKVAFGFPVILCIRDTRGNKQIQSGNTVSIDFGTSSTCAAIRDGAVTRLLTLSGPEKTRTGEDDKEYENPTNIMIYNWEEVRNQWQAANADMPLLLSKSRHCSAEDADYDSGYSVEEVFKNVNDEEGHKMMKAILTDLKNIPTLLHNGHEKKFIPLNDRNRSPISVTDNVDDESASAFNPIKFYGYLLGRVINNPAKKRYYTDYLISFPVMLDTKLREKLRKSLAEGIMRSLPRPVRENMDPEERILMEYEESVACLGAIIPKQLNVGENGEPAIFAIFDLGGGTLDTSYGLLRMSRTPEEEAFAEKVIQLLGKGGDDQVGGERLIHRLAFHIYSENIARMKEHNISFILPPGVPLPNGFDQSLLREPGDQIAESNVHIIIEKIARKLFKHEKEIDAHIAEIFSGDGNLEETVASGCKLKLRDLDDEDVEIDLSITDVEDFLQKQIAAIVNKFQKEMEEVFSGNAQAVFDAGLDEFSVGDVKIFLGGNASQQRFVMETMEKYFPACVIQRIGATDEAKTRHESETVTGKTAVAFGQLRLGGYVVDKTAMQSEEADSSVAPFAFYVGYIDQDTDEFKKVIRRSETSRNWEKANRIDRHDKTSLFYTTDSEGEAQNLIALNKKVEVEDKTRRMLFIRVYPMESNCIEYRLGAPDSYFDPDEEPDENRIIRLKA